MNTEKEKLQSVKNAIEVAFDIKNISLKTHIDEYCIARHLFVKIAFKKISINHTLIMSTIKRSRESFYHSFREANKIIKFNKKYRDIFESVLTELNIKNHEAD